MAKTRNKQRKYFDPNELLRYYLTPNEDGSLRSYKDVAEHFGLTKRRIETIGGRDEWVKQRQEFGEMVNAQYKDDLAELAIQANKDLLNVWFVTLGILRRKAVKYNTLEVAEDKVKVGAKSMKDFTDALRNTTDKIRVLTNQPSDVSKSDVTNRNLTTEVPVEKLNEIDTFLGTSFSEEGEKKNEVLQEQASNPATN